mmetsp:Transcript_10426/g.31879  ORF Transcript_10426/g.31879 Transcript_10426/m.31879 type:complete len:545 (+) Transcript_10426:116-1750(+)|eukprot:CAMPEP_0198726084 /NCGR_PEP_ID=MMETSP1475-20131203/3247_1 /TAXON_ID= ORGANISM="Unidentified sp., Strain CCMP1999" /NCGR_SAMPLE_ID=MMETSP1475 /ASSEMBLY_ACC=CAM_ASM_001111 /LENGTH=544 /DNA_ID=CAMNT_0044487969 /DNA_START=74 /DNA_END=1708 /DNA_ORIENTATION=+
MGTVEVVSRSGRFAGGKLKGLTKELPNSFSVVAALGPACTGKSSVLNRLFNSDFEVSEKPGVQTTFGIQADVIKGTDLAVLAKEPRGLLLLDVEGSDSRDQSRREDQRLLASYALALADVALLTLNMRSIGRLESSGLSSFFRTVEENLQLRAEKTITAQGKLLLVTIVQDFDESEISRQDAIAAIMRDFKVALGAIARPTGFVSTRLTDLFEFEFVMLPDRNLFPEKMDAEIRKFRQRLLESTSDDYLFENSDFEKSASPNEFPDRASNLWQVLSRTAKMNSAPEEEVVATHKCEQSVKEAIRHVQQNMQELRQEVFGGGIVQSFGSSSNKLIDLAIKEYEQLAGDLRHTQAFKRKRADLEETLKGDLGNLYNKQISVLQMNLGERFKRNLDNMRVSSRSRPEKLIENQIKQTDKLFSQIAEEMKCKDCRWMYGKSRMELRNEMRSLSTEWLQAARLQGSYVPGLRPPVNITFHYLNPSVRPEDLLPASLVGDKPDRMITVPQKVKKDNSAKAEPGRMYAHQEASFSGKSVSPASFDRSALPF